MNSVVASVWLDRRRDRIGQPQESDGRLDEIDRLARNALVVVPPAFPRLESLIDNSVDAEVLAQHVEEGESFLLLRYGDGEWYSLLGSAGYNCDRHDFLPESMGKELRHVLHSLASEPQKADRCYVGTTCELGDLSLAALSEISGAEHIHWVTDALFRLGMLNLKTQRFVIACRNFKGRKLIVGSQHLRPIARALNAHHVVIPLRNCYERLDDIERLCRNFEADLVLCCASMASECLLWRLYGHNPDAIYVDCGSIFDVMLGRAIRSEYSSWAKVIAEHYASLFQPYIRFEDS